VLPFHTCEKGTAQAEVKIERWGDLDRKEGFCGY
jgi:hypothetical protein